MASASVYPTTILKGILILLYTCTVFYNGAEACENYFIKVNKLQTCDDTTTIVKAERLTMRVNKDCTVDADGSVELLEKVSTCKLIYDVKKKGMMYPFKGNRDLCDDIAKAVQRPDLAKALERGNVDPNCPINKQKFDLTKEEQINITEYRDKFPMATGRFTGTIKVECDTGKFCIKFDAEFIQGNQPVDSIYSI